MQAGGHANLFPRRRIHLDGRGERSPAAGAYHGQDPPTSVGLAALGPAALRELQGVPTGPQAPRGALARALVGRPDLEPLAQLFALADTDEVVRLRLLRALREVDMWRYAGCVAAGAA